ncbi:MAG: WG repeat-containing protein [Prevotellaceae bacterium]|nr:WG repeat-containing protein [Prevotellaceae bacterium]
MELTPIGIKHLNINSLHKKSVGFLITEKKLASSSCLLEAIICENKIGYIDKNASVIIEPQYDDVRGDFVDSSSVVCVLKEGKWGVINPSNETIIPFQYKELCQFHCGLACARDFNYHYGYINVKNEVIVPFGLYEWIDASYTTFKANILSGYYQFSTKGCARVKQNGKWGIIDTSGKIIVDIKYDKIWTLSCKHLSAIHVEIDREIEYIDLLKLIRMDVKNHKDSRWTYMDDDYDWKSEAWDALTDGQYGDYPEEGYDIDGLLDSIGRG